MRIAFDLDGTLIEECTSQFRLEPTNFLARLVVPIKVRKGTRHLMRHLRREGHELWLYTFSPLPAWKLRLWFMLMGVPLQGVVDLARHERVTGGLGSKQLAQFKIDVLIDNEREIVRRVLRQGQLAFHVWEGDAHWTETVLAGLAALQETENRFARAA
jgi:hypothetical protein